MTKIWKPSEIEYLEQNYATLGRNSCAETLQRSPQSCANKAMRLGLKVAQANKTHEYYLEELFTKEIDWMPLEKYQGSKVKIAHQCIEGHIHDIIPNSVLSGRKCPVCAIITTEDYSSRINFRVMEPYVNMRTKILHECSLGHQWSARPYNIVSGWGCPACSKHGFDSTKPAILYYIKITKDYETYYKLGITNRTITERFRDDKDKQIDIIWTETYSDGKLAQAKELALLQEHKSKRVNITGFLRSGGNSELFEVDILSKE